VLDGIFARAVIVVEADGDRVVYQAAWETLRDAFRIDVHFSTVGGTGGIADTCRLYRTLKIPIAVIADLDMLADPDRTSRILEHLVNDAQAKAALSESCVKVAAEISNLPPTISREEVIHELEKIAGSEMDWHKGDDASLVKSLRSLSNNVDRMRRLKKGGIAAFPPELQAMLTDLIRDLRERGLFLVPVGELEEWLTGRDVGVSKSNKRAWSNAAAQKIQQLGKQDGDVWGFVNSVGDYLMSQ
jgi:hypothetical protein